MIYHRLRCGWTNSISTNNHQKLESDEERWWLTYHFSYKSVMRFNFNIIPTDRFPAISSHCFFTLFTFPGAGKTHAVDADIKLSGSRPKLQRAAMGHLPLTDNRWNITRILLFYWRALLSERNANLTIELDCSAIIRRISHTFQRRPFGPFIIQLGLMVYYREFRSIKIKWQLCAWLSLHANSVQSSCTPFPSSITNIFDTFQTLWCVSVVSLFNLGSYRLNSNSSEHELYSDLLNTIFQPDSYSHFFGTGAHVRRVRLINQQFSMHSWQ